MELYIYIVLSRTIVPAQIFYHIFLFMLALTCLKFFHKVFNLFSLLLIKNPKYGVDLILSSFFWVASRSLTSKLLKSIGYGITGTFSTSSNSSKSIYSEVL